MTGLIYIPFIERSLSLLKDAGECSFICSDRWMKNRYGGPLRAKVSAGYHLKTYIDMVGTAAFNVEVVAYPAITVIARSTGVETRIAHKPAIEAGALSRLSGNLVCGEAPNADSGVTQLDHVASGSEPWLLQASEQLALVRRLEAEFELIEHVGCKVGIGVATGADNAFIGAFDEMDVEPSRKLPLAMIRRDKRKWKRCSLCSKWFRKALRLRRSRTSDCCWNNRMLRNLAARVHDNLD